MLRDTNNEQKPEDSLSVSGSKNKADRLEWFSKQAFGAFIHFSYDVQLGSVISHNLINANDDYCERYFNELPRTFCPDRFDPHEWARFMKLIGVKYVILTNKHHNGFCLWHTQTTPHCIANTPYEKDMTRLLFDACRAQGLAIGVYFSPDDFHFLWKQGKPICREDKLPGLLPRDNPELMALARDQLQELFQKYGAIDVLFIDGDPTGLRELAWALQPDCVVTRGALKTPEQGIPEVVEESSPGNPEPWEACLTIGRQWQYRATDEAYKSPRALAEILIATRAGGGNLLLNFGPKPNGEMDATQEGIMRKLGFWIFVNKESIYDVQPCSIAREGDIFFTRSVRKNTVYAHLTNIDWPRLPFYPDTESEALYGHEMKIDSDGLYSAWDRRLRWRIKSIRADKGTRIEMMAQKVENSMSRGAPITLEWEQLEDELVITAWHNQRLLNDWHWDMPMTVKIVNPASH